MPLIKSKSKEAFSRNVSAEMHAGKPQKQALAIAYSVARRSKKADGGGLVPKIKDEAEGRRLGHTLIKIMRRPLDARDAPGGNSDRYMQELDAVQGKRALDISDAIRGNKPGYAAGGMPKIAPQTPTAPWYQRSALRNMSGAKKGMLGGASPGRVDNLPIDVKSGSYVIPADSVSALGQGNSSAGAKFLSKMFSGAKMNSYGGGRFRMPGVSGMRRGQFAEGGEAEGAGKDVPIIAASGEYVLSPEEVAWFGNGDMKKGHDALDRFVMSLRKKHIQELKRIKPPRKN